MSALYARTQKWQKAIKIKHFVRYLIGIVANYFYILQRFKHFLQKQSLVNLTFIGPCIIVIVEEQKTNLMSLAILFHCLCAQHISSINISIIRSLRLFYWITTLVVLFLVRCVLEFGVIGLEWYPCCRLKQRRSEKKNSKWHQIGLLFFKV